MKCMSYLYGQDIVYKCKGYVYYFYNDGVIRLWYGMFPSPRKDSFCIEMQKENI